MIDSAKSANGPDAASSGSVPFHGASPRGERKEIPESLSSSFRDVMREDGVKAGKHGGEAVGRLGEDGVKAGKHGGGRAADADGETVGHQGGDEEPNSHTSAALSGDALLRGLGGNYAPLTGEAAEIGADRPALASELLDRILVGKTEQIGETGEVRLTLKESVLPDTEIILRREGEKLIVTLVTDNAASYRILQQTRHDLHEKLLALQDDTSVEVSFQDGSGQEEGGQSGGEASPRRSRGLDYYG
jgi:type III secretion system needle length determinant